jgi:hypothetical protein
MFRIKSWLCSGSWVLTVLHCEKLFSFPPKLDGIVRLLIKLVSLLSLTVSIDLPFVLKVLYWFKMAVCLSFSDIVEGKSTQLSLKVAAGKSIDTVKDNNISIVRWRGQSQRTIEILPECVGDFTVLHFLPVFDFIPHFYQLFLVSHCI